MKLNHQELNIVEGRLTKKDEQNAVDKDHIDSHGFQAVKIHVICEL